MCVCVDGYAWSPFHPKIFQLFGVFKYCLLSIIYEWIAIQKGLLLGRNLPGRDEKIKPLRVSNF